MQQFLSSLYSTHKYDNPIQKNRAMTAYALITVMLLLYTSNSLLLPQVEGYTLFQALIEFGAFTQTTAMVLALYVLAIFGFVAVRQGALNIGCWLVVAAWYAGGVGPILYSPVAITMLGAPLLIVILLASLLHQRNGLMVGLPVSLITLVIAYFMRDAAPEPVANYIVVAVHQLGGTLVLYLAQRFSRVTLTRGVSEAVEERVKSAEIISQVTQLVAQRVPSEEVLTAIVTHIVGAFDYIGRARIYLVDETGAESQLMADTGQSMNSAQTQVMRASVGGLSTIGQVTLYGTPHIGPVDGGRVIQAVFPLRVGSRIIGVLDVLTEDEEAFNRPDVMNAMQALSDTLALVIDNVRQFERAETRNKDNQKLVEELRTALRERERLTQRLTGSAWSQYIRNSREALGLAIDFEANDVGTVENWTPTLAEAVKINHFVQEQGEDRQVVTMPLRVRGQVIGAMEFELEPDRAFTPEDLELLQEVSERFGLAAENTRLVQDSQRLAQREALVNQISARLQTTNNVQGTLSEAARGLREAFKATRVVIQLGAPNDVNAEATQK